MIALANLGINRPKPPSPVVMPAEPGASNLGLAVTVTQRDRHSGFPLNREGATTHHCPPLLWVVVELFGTHPGKAALCSGEG
jgi:hypothetical protein